MELTKNPRGDLLELELAGHLDNESAVHLQEEIDAAVRGGWHRLYLDLGQVGYLSSAGIGVLLRARKQLEALHGFFGIWNLTPAVEQILQQTKVLDLLLRHPRDVPASAATGSMTFQSETRMAVEEGVSFQRYSLGDDHAMSCRLFGSPLPLYSGGFRSDAAREIVFPQDSFGLGLGSLGTGTDIVTGEVLAVSGAVAQSAASRRGIPDYLLARGEFIPSARMLYGLKCTGAFAELIRFEAWEAAQPIPFSRLTGHLLKLMNCNTAGMVLVAECAGLIGTRLRKPPLEDEGNGRFRFPEIRDWFSYSSEQVHRQTLVLIAGVARREGPRDEGPGSRERQQTRSPLDPERSSLDPILRPLDDAGSLLGHFHAAVFPYRPLKKRTLKLQPLVSDFFESGTILDVLHLLHHKHPLAGSGESELTSGGCWIAPIRDVTVEGTQA